MRHFAASPQPRVQCAPGVGACRHALASGGSATPHSGAQHPSGLGLVYLTRASAWDSAVRTAEMEGVNGRGDDHESLASLTDTERQARIGQLSATRTRRSCISPTREYSRAAGSLCPTETTTSTTTALRQDVVRAVARLCPGWMSQRRDDLVQIAVMRVMRITEKRSASDEVNEPLSTSYLYKVAYSVLVDEIRRLRRHPETDLEDDAVAPLAVATGESRAHGRVEGDRPWHPGVSGADEARTATRCHAPPAGTHGARSGQDPRLGRQADGEPRLSRPGRPSKMPSGQGDTTVTETRSPDERLADAFRAIEDSSEAAVPDSDRDRIWLAVSGVLPAEERRALVERMATSPAYAEAWRVAHEMWQASQGTAAETARHSRPRRTRDAGRRRGCAAAAVLLVGTTIGLVSLREQQSGDQFRSSPGMSCSRACQTPARCHVTRSGCNGQPGRRAHATGSVSRRTISWCSPLPPISPSRSSLVAAPLLSALPAGATVLWQVDAYLPDGERVTSRTFVTHVR